MTTHHLKIQRQPFADLVSGRKTGEVRNCADREFREGDQVELFLMDESGNPDIKSIVRTITHIQRGCGLPDDICVLSYAAPAVERQPVARWTDETGNLYRLCPVVVNLEIKVSAYGEAENWDSVQMTPAHALTKLSPLFASHPEPVSVVLPERFNNALPFDGSERGYDVGWNGCLDEFARLNTPH